MKNPKSNSTTFPDVGPALFFFWRANRKTSTRCCPRKQQLSFYQHCSMLPSSRWARSASRHSTQNTPLGNKPPVNQTAISRPLRTCLVLLPRDPTPQHSVETGSHWTSRVVGSPGCAYRPRELQRNTGKSCRCSSPSARHPQPWAKGTPQRHRISLSGDSGYSNMNSVFLCH